MTTDGDSPASACCGSVGDCIFAKALLAQALPCECARRGLRGEASSVDCTQPLARTNCATLAALLRERSRFALRLPGAGRPLLHVQALRLQCGGLAALRESLAGPDDVHRLVMHAQQRCGSLADLPWAELVPRLAAWQPPRRRPA